MYPPAFFAKTEELIELCKVAAKYQGKYVAHLYEKCRARGVFREVFCRIYCEILRRTAR